jgi:hypothetical protein
MDEPAARATVCALADVRSAPPLESVERLDAELARLHLTVFARFVEKLETAKDALAYACPGGKRGRVSRHASSAMLCATAVRAPRTPLTPALSPRFAGGEGARQTK